MSKIGTNGVPEGEKREKRIGSWLKRLFSRKDVLHTNNSDHREPPFLLFHSQKTGLFESRAIKAKKCKADTGFLCSLCKQ